MLGLIFPPSLLATTALGGIVGGMTASLRGDVADADTIKAMAESMEPGTSMLVAVVEPEWAGELEAALDGEATKIGWAVIDQAAARLTQTQAKVGKAE